MIVGRYKIHAEEINMKNRMNNYYFYNLVKAKKLKTKTVKIDEKHYKDLQ